MEDKAITSVCKQLAKVQLPKLTGDHDWRKWKVGITAKLTNVEGVKLINLFTTGPKFAKIPYSFDGQNEQKGQDGNWFKPDSLSQLFAMTLGVLLQIVPSEIQDELITLPHWTVAQAECKQDGVPVDVSTLTEDEKEVELCDFPHPCMIWKLLLSRYESNNPAREAGVLEELMSIKMIGNNATDYIAKLQQCFATLASFDNKQSDHTKLCYLYRGLPASAEVLKNTLRIDKKTTFATASESIISFYDTRKYDLPNAEVTEAQVANVKSNKFCHFHNSRSHSDAECKSNKKNVYQVQSYQSARPQCPTCGKNNHTADKCFVTHPELLKRYNENKSAAASTSQESVTKCAFCGRTNHTTAECRYKPKGEVMEIESHTISVTYEGTEVRSSQKSTTASTSSSKYFPRSAMFVEHFDDDDGYYGHELPTYPKAYNCTLDSDSDSDTEEYVPPPRIEEKSKQSQVNGTFQGLDEINNETQVETPSSLFPLQQHLPDILETLQTNGNSATTQLQPVCNDPVVETGQQSQVMDVPMISDNDVISTGFSSRSIGANEECTLVIEDMKEKEDLPSPNEENVGKKCEIITKDSPLVCVNVASHTNVSSPNLLMQDRMSYDLERSGIEQFHKKTTSQSTVVNLMAQMSISRLLTDHINSYGIGTNLAITTTECFTQFCVPNGLSSNWVLQPEWIAGFMSPNHGGNCESSKLCEPPPYKYSIGIGTNGSVSKTCFSVKLHAGECIPSGGTIQGEKSRIYKSNAQSTEGEIDIFYEYEEKVVRTGIGTCLHLSIPISPSNHLCNNVSDQTEHNLHQQSKVKSANEREQSVCGTYADARDVGGGGSDQLSIQAESSTQQRVHASPSVQKHLQERGRVTSYTSRRTIADS
jgi:hypothetical protein